MSSSKDGYTIDDLSELVSHDHDQFDLAKKEFQRRKFQFITELASLLCVHKNTKDLFTIITDLIIFSLQRGESCFLDKTFIEKNRNLFTHFNVKNYFMVFKKIHKLVFQSSNLSDRQKVKFLQLERYFIKLYFECT